MAGRATNGEGVEAGVGDDVETGRGDPGVDAEGLDQVEEAGVAERIGGLGVDEAPGQRLAAPPGQPRPARRPRPRRRPARRRRAANSRDSKADDQPAESPGGQHRQDGPSLVVDDAPGHAGVPGDQGCTGPGRGSDHRWPHSRAPGRSPSGHQPPVELEIPLGQVFHREPGGPALARRHQPLDARAPCQGARRPSASAGGSPGAHQQRLRRRAGPRCGSRAGPTPRSAC